MIAEWLSWYLNKNAVMKLLNLRTGEMDTTCLLLKSEECFIINRPLPIIF